MKSVVFRFAGTGCPLELERESFDSSLDSYNFVSGFPVISPLKKANRDKDDFFGFVGFSGL